MRGRAFENSSWPDDGSQTDARRLICPHCCSAIDLADDPVETEIKCPTCGSSFRLDPYATERFDPTEPIRRLDRYELLQELGAGTFGQVYQARDTSLDRIVAVKIPNSRLPTQPEVDFILREARAAAQLKHPNIVAIHDYGTTKEHCYVVCEFVSGASLADRLTTRRLTFNESVELMADVAEALDYAHRQGVIHRDLKPANIMLDMEGKPHIVDFGLAVRVGEITITSQGIIGTPAYMSPEQGEAQHVDGRSDIYSLGVILYEVLTGELPFRGNRQMQQLQRLHDEVRPLRLLNDHIPMDLETITLKCLSRDPDQRFSTAAELAAELRRWLKGEPILSRPIGKLERARRWCRRKPALALSISSAALAVTFALAALSLAYMREVRFAQQMEANAAVERRLKEDNARKAATERKLREEKEQLAATEATLRARAEELRHKANLERQAALDSEDQARNAFTFLVLLFESADPLELKRIGFRHPDNEAKPITARELLDRGRERVEKEFAGKPLIQASLLDGLGMGFLGLGDTEAAKPLLNRAQQIRDSEQLPADHPAVLSGLLNMAYLKIIHAELDDAENHLRTVLNAQQRAQNFTPLALARTRFLLGIVLMLKHQPEEAEPMLKEALDAREELLGDQHQETMFARTLLVAAIVGQGKPVNTLQEGLKLAAAAPLATAPNLMSFGPEYISAKYAKDDDTAVAKYGKLREAARQHLSDSHPMMILLDFEYASRLHQQGDYRQAVDIAQETLSHVHKVIAKNPRMAEAHLKYGIWLANQGQRAEAESHLKLAMEIGRNILINDRLFGLEAAIELARWKRRWGDAAEAEQLCLKVIDQLDTVKSTGASRTVMAKVHEDTQLTLLEILLDTGRSLDALTSAQQLYETLWPASGNQQYSAVRFSQVYAACLREQGDFGKAHQVARNTAHMVREHLSNLGSEANVADLQESAACLQRTGNGAALDLWRRSVATARETIRPGHPELASSLLAAAVSFNAHGLPDEAEHMLEEVLSITREKLGNNHRDTIRAMLAMAETKRKLGQSMEAIRYAREAYEVASEAHGSIHEVTQEARRVLGAALAANEQFQEAELLLRSRLDIAQQHFSIADSCEAVLDLSDLLLLEKKYDSSASILADASTRFAKLLSAWQLAEINSRLGACESALGKPVVAQSLLQESRETLKSAWGEADLRVRQATDRLIGHYRQTGDLQAAEQLRATNNP